MFVLETSFKAKTQGQQETREEDGIRGLEFLGPRGRKLRKWDTLAASGWDEWWAAVGWARGLGTITKHDFYKIPQQHILELALSYDLGEWEAAIVLWSLFEWHREKVYQLAWTSNRTPA